MVPEVLIVFAECFYLIILGSIYNGAGTMTYGSDFLAFYFWQRHQFQPYG